MTKHNPQTDSAQLELVDKLDNLTFFEGVIPTEDRCRRRHAALRANIEEYGQVVPVNLTDHNQYCDGRARVRIARELGRPLLVRRMSAMAAVRAAVATLLTGHLTVSDQARVVAWVAKTKFADVVGETRKHEAVSHYLQENLGWQQGASSRQVGRHLELAEQLDDLSPLQRKVLPHATSLGWALEMMFSPERWQDLAERRGG